MKENHSSNFYRNKYRSDSIRLKKWNYSNSGYYFITICTKDMRSYFGEIEQGKMIKNQIGKTAGKYWIEIPEYFLNFTTDEFIIMPNHIHGILIIENNLNYDSNDTFNKFQKLRKKSLSTAINQYKGAVTRYCKNKKLNFSWHSGFYEHIIRNENSLQKIKEYIVNNPAKWELDEYYRKQKKQL